MIDLVFYIAILTILTALIIFFMRQKGSYFRSIQILFVMAILSFSAIVFCDLIKNHLTNAEWAVVFTTIGGMSGAITTAIMVEHAALTLYKKESEKIPLKDALFKRLNLTSIAFKGYAVSVLLITWVFAPWQSRLITNIWGEHVYIPVYEWWYLALLSGVLIAFIAYPCTLFLLLGRKYKEKPVADALTWLGACWISIGFILIIFHGLLRSLGFETIEVGFSLDVLYFGIIAYFFQKTTILESFFEKPYLPIQVGKGESIFLTYTSKADKMKIFSTYILDGLLGGERVIYKYPDDEDETVREKLREHGIDVERYERDGSLILTTLSQFYLSKGSLDEEKAINFLSELKVDSHKKGYKQLRDFVDLGDLSFFRENVDRYIKYLNDERWKDYLDEYLIELFAVNTEKLSDKHFRELTNVYAATRTTSSIDLIEHTSTFSQLFGLTHKEIIGRNVLLEIDPASNYEKVIQDFTTEASANIESVVVFSSKGSAIHSALSGEKNVRFLLLTQRISIPEQNASTNDVLLPANNTSLLLDALDKALETQPYGNLNVVFDSLSSLILLVGFDKTYSFTRYALEMLASRNATTLFLFNPSAHDQKVASSLRNLFDIQVLYGKGGLQIVKAPKPMLRA